jgi:hypothetical protein
VRSCSENIHAVTDRSISTTRNQTASPLLRLPADLRDIIFRFALYPVTVYVAFEPITPIRQGLTLPQVCRQIQRETKFVVNTYETVHLNVGPDCMWSANDFVRLASDLRAIFSTIVTLQLSPAATEWMNYQAVFSLYDAELDVFFDWSPNPIPEIFKSLKRLIFRSENSSLRDRFRALFGKPDLEMVYF